MALDLGYILPPGNLTQNVGGHTGRVRVSRISDMDVIQKKAEVNDSPTPTDPTDLIEISADHTWLAGKGAVEFYITRDSGKSDFEMNQARDTTGTKTKYVGKTPGSEALNHAFLTLGANAKVLFWAELADGKWEQLGSERFPAEMKIKWSSGTNESEYRGFEITVESFETTFQMYSGAFQMDDNPIS